MPPWTVQDLNLWPSACDADALRCNPAYAKLHDPVTKTSSKSHSALTRPLGSHFTGTSATCPNGLPRLTVPPCAFNVSGTLPATPMPIAETTSREDASPRDTNLVKVGTRRRSRT